MYRIPRDLQSHMLKKMSNLGGDSAKKIKQIMKAWRKFASLVRQKVKNVLMLFMYLLLVYNNCMESKKMF